MKMNTAKLWTRHGMPSPNTCGLYTSELTSKNSTTTNFVVLFFFFKYEKLQFAANSGSVLY